MDNITLGEIVEWLLWLAGAIGAIGVIYKAAMIAFSKALSSVNNKLDGLATKIDDADVARAQDYIVRFLADVEQDEPVSNEETKRFWENYDLYSVSHNSYVHEKVEKLKKAGKL